MNPKLKSIIYHLKSITALFKSPLYTAIPCLIIGVLCFGPMTGSAQGQQKSPVTHTVKKGETLYSIAQQYDVSVDQIRQWNDLTTDQLQAGQTLRIGAKKSETTEPSQQTKGDTQQESSGSYYVVKSGDTLFEIARKHDMSVEQLKSLNNLTSNNIRVGQRLLVRQPTPTPSVAEKATGSAPQGQFIRYTLEGGESWSDLTQKFAMDSVELAHLNPETRPNELFKGKKITVLKSPTNTYQNPYRVDSQMRLISTMPVISYDDDMQGVPTSSGELYNPKSLTAAHPSISLGSIIYVVNRQNRRGVYVKVNDRIDQNRLKLSDRAYQVLHISGNNPRVQIYQQP